MNLNLSHQNKQPDKVFAEYSYVPKNINILKELYQGLREKNVLVWQKHLWDYKESYIREKRSQEIIRVASDILDEL